MSQESTPASVANGWSKQINGLSGRLHVEFEDLDPGLRYACYLELRNHSFVPIAVNNQPEVNAELYDESTQPVSISPAQRSGLVVDAQWAVIPRDAYIGFRIDMQSIGVPTREQGRVLLAVGGKTWELSSGRYWFHVKLGFSTEEGAPPNQWVGELELPPVEVEVTAEMVAVK